MVKLPNNNPVYSKNMELIAYHNLNEIPGFQMAMQKAKDRWYLYVTGRAQPGWHIMDVTDPAKPKIVQFLKGPEGSSSIKVQVAGGIMVAQMQGSVEGMYVFDVKTDPENPKFLGHWSTGEPGGHTHRFYFDGGRYVHLSSTCKGFGSRIYRIVDIIDPKHPVEVGRWWRQEQWLAGMKKSEVEAFTNRKDAATIGVWLGLHGDPAIKDNLAYCPYGDAGLIILDISDITLPQKVGQLKFNPPLGGGPCGAWCHTAVPLSQKPYVVFTSEGERFPLFTKQILATKILPPLAMFGIADVSNPTNPTLISMMPYPEVPPGYPFKNFNDCGIGAIGPLGPHNLHEPHGHPDLEDRNDRIYCCYFHAGLRVYDISDPFVPKEIAYYLPPNPSKPLHGEVMKQEDPTFGLHARPRGPLISTTEDVIVDKRGYIFMDTFHNGLYVLKCTV